MRWRAASPTRCSRIIWAGRETMSLRACRAQALALEPADICDVDLDGGDADAARHPDRGRRAPPHRGADASSRTSSRRCRRRRAVAARRERAGIARRRRCCSSTCRCSPAASRATRRGSPPSPSRGRARSRSRSARPRAASLPRQALERRATMGELTDAARRRADRRAGTAPTRSTVRLYGGALASEPRAGGAQRRQRRGDRHAGDRLRGRPVRDGDADRRDHVAARRAAPRAGAAPATSPRPATPPARASSSSTARSSRWRSARRSRVWPDAPLRRGRRGLRPGHVRRRAADGRAPRASVPRAGASRARPRSPAAAT